MRSPSIDEGLLVRMARMVAVGVVLVAATAGAAAIWANTFGNTSLANFLAMVAVAVVSTGFILLMAGFFIVVIVEPERL